MNSLPIFYRDRITSKIIMNGNNEKTTEENICPICEDNKVSAMLNCYVI